MENFKQKLRHISCFALDMDGVLTNGLLTIMPDGQLLRTMNIKDGFAMQHAVKNGYHVVIISGGTPPGAVERLHKLGVREVYTAVTDKLGKLTEVMDRLKLKTENVLFMGDDVPDVEVMKHAGIAAAPRDAMAEVREISHYVSEYRGGEGCVRDVIEQAMRLHEKWHQN